MTQISNLTEEELSQATDALLAWFQSQSLTPSQSMAVITKFIALMIIDQPDSKTANDLVRKSRNIANCIDMQITLELWNRASK